MLLFARSPRRQVGDARIYFFTAYTLSFRALVEKSPAEETRTSVHELPKTLARAGSAPRQPTCPRWLTAEKSPAEETKTNVYVTRRDEGVPPYRRLRSESDTIVIASEAWQSRGNEIPPTYPRGLRAPRWLTAEKPPAKETGTSVHVTRRSEGEPPYRRLRSESDTIVIASEAWQSRGNELPPILARAGSAPRGGSPPAGAPCRKKTIRSFLPRESFFYIRYSVFATRTAYFRLLRLYVFRVYCGLFSRPKSFSFVPENVYFRACDGGKPCRLL